jgi:pimeloyl-ACP methyl ester carboxylesterase
MGEVQSRDGTTIAFERSGDGPPVVLVDGALSHRRLGPMARLAEPLAADFTVFAYDRRGRGESGDTAPYDVVREVADLAAVIDAAGGPAAVFGLSSGAALALEATAAGLPVTRLALYEPPYGLEPDEDPAYVARLHELLAAGRRGDAVEWFLSNAGVPAEALAGMRSQPEWPAFEAVAPTLAYDHAVLGDGAVPRERAARIGVPTLVANGEESPEFFLRAAQATAAAIPGAEHRAIAGQAWGRADMAALAPVLRAFFSSR